MKTSNWQTLQQRCRSAWSGLDLPEQDRIPDLDYALTPYVFWRCGKWRPAYDLGTITEAHARKGEHGLREAFALLARLLSDGVLVFSSRVQRVRFWQDVQAGKMIAWEHMTPCIVGVLIQASEPQVPVYDWSALVEVADAATQPSSRLKEKVKGRKMEEFLTDMHRKLYMGNTAACMPAYRFDT